jgi:hypothetical protein
MLILTGILFPLFQAALEANSTKKVIEQLAEQGCPVEADAAFVRTIVLLDATHSRAELLRPAQHLPRRAADAALAPRLIENDGKKHLPDWAIA